MFERMLGGKRIFVVEDDVINMAVISAMLRQQGAIVMQDFWNVNTVSLLTRIQPMDVILLDLMLRYQMSGYDIFNSIRAIPEFRELPIVAVSAADPALEIPKLQAAGFSGFISKPLDLHRFPQQILDCINHQSVWEYPGLRV